MTIENPITDLKNDHRLIEAVLSALESKLSAGGAVPVEFVEQALNFLVEYADRYHHHKEEEVLFPALAARGVPVEGGPIGMMLYEHTVGRRLLSGIRENLAGARQGEYQASDAIRTFATEYIELLRGHIWKEDNVLFMLAERVLNEQSAQDVLERFKAQLESSAAVLAKQREFAEHVSLTEP